MRLPLIIRRVSGNSMLPLLRPGQIVVASGWLPRPKKGAVVIIKHSGLEKIKRISTIDKCGVFIVGDNLAASTDSRDFGRLPLRAVCAVAIWPRL